MNQPTREEITQKVNRVLDGSLTREAVCEWAADYIRNDEQICIDDLEAWHYLVEISNIGEMIGPNEYLYNEDDIRDSVIKYTFQKIKQDIYEWGQKDILKYLSPSDELELSKNSDDILIFDFTFHNCLAQLTVSNPQFAPYQYVDFEAIAGESENPELIYFFYDSKDMTEEEVFHELEVGIQYCSGYIPNQLRNKYLNKRGTLTIEHENLHYVVHPDDLGKINIESISGEFVCIDVEAQYLVVMRDSFAIRIIERIFNTI